MTSGVTYCARNTPAMVGPITPPIVLKIEFIAVAIPVSNCDTDCMTILIIDTITSPIPTDINISPKTTCTCVSVSYTHLRAHETDSYLVCRLLLEKKKKQYYNNI